VDEAPTACGGQIVTEEGGEVCTSSWPEEGAWGKTLRGGPVRGGARGMGGPSQWQAARAHARSGGTTAAQAR
jgi:hypothetical protein